MSRGWLDERGQEPEDRPEGRGQGHHQRVRQGGIQDPRGDHRRCGGFQRGDRGHGHDRLGERRHGAHPERRRRLGGGRRALQGPDGAPERDERQRHLLGAPRRTVSAAAGARAGRSHASAPKAPSAVSSHCGGSWHFLLARLKDSRQTDALHQRHQRVALLPGHRGPRGRMEGSRGAVRAEHRRDTDRLFRRHPHRGHCRHHHHHEHPGDLRHRAHGGDRHDARPGRAEALRVAHVPGGDAHRHHRLRHRRHRPRLRA